MIDSDPSSRPHARRVIVLAESDAEVRASAQEMFARRGFAVETVADGAELLRVVDALTEPPAGVILDSDMCRLHIDALSEGERLAKLGHTPVFISGGAAGGFVAALRISRRWCRSRWMLLYVVRQIEAHVQRPRAISTAA